MVKAREGKYGSGVWGAGEAQEGKDLGNRHTEGKYTNALQVSANEYNGKSRKQRVQTSLDTWEDHVENYEL